MDAAVGGIADIHAAARVEGEAIRLPVRRQSGRGGRSPNFSQRHAAQAEHAQPVIAGIAEKQIPGADADSMRRRYLAGAAAYAAQTRNRHELARAGVEALQPPWCGVEQPESVV